jgi:flagellar hook-associated protein 3 FlgL
MRVSTAWIFNSGSQTLMRKQAELLQTQEQLSSGKRVVRPSDDPGAASNALTTEQARARVAQYIRNQGTAQSTLQLAESSLAQAGEALQGVRELAVAAGNGALSRNDRAALAVDVRGRLEHLLGMANARDASGAYLFSGYQDGVQPFVRSAAGIAYQGDQGSRALQVGAQRLLEVSASGSEVFEGARAGNGHFTITAGAANGGAAWADAGQVANPAALTGDSYRVTFTSATTYDVVDVTSGATLVTGAAYAPGATLAFAGMQFTITGAPAAGDRFDVAPSARQSSFALLDEFATLLEQSAAGTVGQAEYQTRLASISAGLDQAHDHVLSVRTALGARLRELDALGAQAADETLLHQQELSRLVDLDYAEGASRLAQQQLTTQAAQQSYLRLTSLSLFNFL